MKITRIMEFSLHNDEYGILCPNRKKMAGENGACEAEYGMRNEGEKIRHY